MQGEEIKRCEKERFGADIGLCLTARVQIDQRETRGKKETKKVRLKGFTTNRRWVQNSFQQTRLIEENRRVVDVSIGCLAVYGVLENEMKRESRESGNQADEKCVMKN